jgi:hypothetical protein
MNELMVKNDTAYTICYDLSNRKRHRKEPLKLTRYARRIKQKIEVMGYNTFSMDDFYDTIKYLEALGWGAVKNNTKGNPGLFFFAKDVKDFTVETDIKKEDKRAVVSTPRILRDVIETKKEGIRKNELLTYQIVLPEGKVTIETTEGKLKAMTVRIKDLFLAS